jgi:hypothetical protein
MPVCSGLRINVAFGDATIRKMNLVFQTITHRPTSKSTSSQQPLRSAPAQKQAAFDPISNA